MSRFTTNSRLAAIVLFALASACVRQGGDVVTTRAGNLTLEVQPRTNPPRQGENTIDVTVKDDAGRAVDGAEVDLTVSMPAMAGMPEMRSSAGVEPRGDGRYRGKVDVASGGTWTLDVAIESKSGSGKATYSFTVGTEGLSPTGAEAATSPALERAELTDDVVTALTRAFAAYEEVRKPLAADALEEARAAAPPLEEALRAIGAAFGQPDTDVGHCLEQGAAASKRIAEADDLAAARGAFGELSRFLIAIAAAEPRISVDLHLFQCPMTAAPNRWMQPSAEVDNPYLGRAMPDCGVEQSWSTAAGPSARLAGAAATASAGDDVAYYSCSMHTHVRSEVPGKCPICSMDLVGVTRGEIESGEIVVDAGRRQTIGVRTGKVERRALRREVRAAGKVAFDETRLAEVSVKYAGWIERLEVNATGQPVRRGQVLFTLYSPELYAAQGEYLAALESQRRARATGAPDRADYLVEASRERLRLWDLRDEDLERIAAGGQPIKSLPIVSPATGHVVEKNVVQGAAVEPGRTLYRIASLDRVWVEADVPESDLGLVAVGQRARVTLPNLPGKELDGNVTFLYPYLDEAARTGRLRIELANPRLELKPAMYADVVLEVDRGEALMVPDSAVLYAGERRLVFLDLGEGRLKPRPVEVGLTAEGWIEVLSGLEEGERVVTSGTFLVAAESRLKSGTEQWE